MAERLRERLLYGRFVGRTVLYPLASWGYDRFRSTGETPRSAYAAMRKLYGNSDNRLFDRLVARAVADGHAADVGPDVDGVASGQVQFVVDRLRHDGFAMLPRRLEADQCDELEALARSVECSLVGVDGPVSQRRRFDEREPMAVRYEVGEEDIVQSPAAQRLIVDQSLLAVATRYLGTTPVQDLVAMWWSAAVGTMASAAAAQQFHFDLDRLQFLKVFVFLTDVDESTGPHVYVRGTHGRVPQRFRKDGRYEDALVLPVFGNDVRSITGPRGTIFLADTRGLHKGMNLETGHRLMFQTEYATSLFGAPYARPVLHDPTPEFLEMKARHPATFRRFGVASTISS